MQELKSRLEVLLGAAPEAPVDETGKQQAEQTTRKLGEGQRERVAAAGGELLGAAFKLLGELVGPASSAPPDELVSTVRNGLNACVQNSDDGTPRLTISLPDRGALEGLAQSLARLLAAGAAGRPA
jgi:hypothetical protein